MHGDLICERTGEGRKPVTANGIKFGRRRKPSIACAMTLSNAVMPVKP